MNVNTGHLVVVGGGRSSHDEYLAKMKQLMDEGYEPVPAELEDAANLELAGRESCHVGANSSGSMSTYMRGKREKKIARSRLRRIAGCKK